MGLPLGPFLSLSLNFETKNGLLNIPANFHVDIFINFIQMDPDNNNNNKQITNIES